MGLWIALTLLLVVAATAVGRTAYLLDARVERLRRSVGEWGELARVAADAGASQRRPTNGELERAEAAAEPLSMGAGRGVSRLGRQDRRG